VGQSSDIEYVELVLDEQQGAPRQACPDRAQPHLVHELVTNVDLAGDMQNVLPKRMQPCYGPAAAGLQQIAGQLAPSVLASPRV
jgi:hypothetical protein